MIRRHAAAALAMAWRVAPAGILVQIGSALAGGVVPILAAWLTKSVLDGLAGGGPLPLADVVGLAVAGVVVAVVPHVATYAAAEQGRRVALLARERHYTAVNGFAGLSKLEDPAFQDRLRLAEQGSHAGPDRLISGLLGTGQAGVGLVGFLGTLVVLSPVMAGVVLLAAVPAFVVHLALSRAHAAMQWRLGHGERREDFYAQLLSAPYAAKEVRLFGLGGFLRDRMLRELGAVNDEYRALDRRRLRAYGALALLAAAVAGAGLVWVVGQAGAGRLTIGDVAVFVVAVAGVQAALAGGIQHAAITHQGLLLFDHYRTVLATASDIAVPARPTPVPALRRGIALRDVWFRYSPDHPWILRGVDLFLPCGQTVALVGLNGAGKSALVKLLIVLDNAKSDAQVGPLLPGAPGCLAIITSRRRLVGLDFTHTLSLDVLPHPDAIAPSRARHLERSVARIRRHRPALRAPPAGHPHRRGSPVRPTRVDRYPPGQAAARPPPPPCRAGDGTTQPHRRPRSVLSGPDSRGAADVADARPAPRPGYRTARGGRAHQRQPAACQPTARGPARRPPPARTDPGALPDARPDPGVCHPCRPCPRASVIRRSGTWAARRHASVSRNRDPAPWEKHVEPARCDDPLDLGSAKRDQEC